MTNRDWITDDDVREIYEFVCGMFSGIRLSGKSRSDVLEDDFWMNWCTEVEVNVWYCDEKQKWNITCYHYKDYETSDDYDDDFSIDIEDKWQ